MTKVRRLLVCVCMLWTNISGAAIVSLENRVLAIDEIYFQSLADGHEQTSGLLHTDFQYLTAYGTSLSKPQLLAYLEKSPQLVDQFELLDRQVWVNGDYAVVIGRAVTAGGDLKFSRVESRYWHLWARVGDTWQLLLRQAELLTPKPEL